jgi:hypothetical protein
MAHLLFNPAPTNVSGSGAELHANRLNNWQQWTPECGCSWVLPAGVAIPIQGVGATGFSGGSFTGAPGDHVSPMSNYGVGRGNPGPWNVPWSRHSAHEDSGYMSPHNTDITTWNATMRPDWIKQAQGYYRAQPIFTGMAIRARAFDRTGMGGPTETNTYIVSSGSASQTNFSNWQNMRIVSIVMPPEHFAHPITGIYRNWDRGFQSRDYGSGNGQQGAAVGSGSGDHWVVRGWTTNEQRGGWGHRFPNQRQTPPTWGVDTWPWFWQAPRRTRYPYAWQGQIRAGLWDGRDALGAVVSGMNGGYGLPVVQPTVAR